MKIFLVSIAIFFFFFIKILFDLIYKFQNTCHIFMYVLILMIDRRDLFRAYIKYKKRIKHKIDYVDKKNVINESRITIQVVVFKWCSTLNGLLVVDRIFVSFSHNKLKLNMWINVVYQYVFDLKSWIRVS